MENLIYVAIDTKTSIILAIFKNGSDCTKYCEENENALQVPFNAKHHPAEARNLFVGDKYVVA